jgi:hypothetical protein
MSLDLKHLSIDVLKHRGQRMHNCNRLQGSESFHISCRIVALVWLPALIWGCTTSRPESHVAQAPSRLVLGPDYTIADLTNSYPVETSATPVPYELHPPPLASTQKTEIVSPYDQHLSGIIRSNWLGLIDQSSYHYTGVAVIPFRLYPNGKVDSLRTLFGPPALAALCQQAIVISGPFPEWPEEMRRAGTNSYRMMQYTFDCDLP